MSPVQSYPVVVRGRIIGRGESGNVFSEDMILQDKSGIIFLDFQHGLSNWYFALFKWDKFKGQDVEIEGWYRRAPVPYIELKSIRSNTTSSTSLSFYYKLLGWCLLIGLGVVIVFFRK